MRNTPRILLWVALFVMCMSFQNCGEFRSDAVSLSGSTGQSVFRSLSDPSIWSLNRKFVSGHGMIFYVNLQIFGLDSTYNWFYQISGSPTGCSSQQFQDINSVRFVCDRAGVIQLTLVIVGASGSSRSLYLNAIVEDGAGSTGRPDSDFLYTNSEIVMNLDGTPGPAYQGPPIPGPSPTATSGAQLYSTHCLSCHGQLSQSTKRGRSASQIQSAISSQPQMSALVSLTQLEVSRIADALK